MNLTEKLLYIQQNLKVPKNQRNRFGDFNYRSCEDILEAVKPLLEKTKTVLLISDDIQIRGERFYVMATAILKDAESSEVISNQAFAREADNKTKMDAAQVTGSSSTYARKYALNGLFCIDDSRDPDMAEPEGRGNRQTANRNEPKQQTPPEGRGGTGQGNRESDGRVETNTTQNSDRYQTDSSNSSNGTKAEPKYVGPDCVSRLMAEMRRTGVTEERLIQQCGIRSLSEVTKEQYENIMHKFSCTPTKNQRAAG